MDTVIFVSGLNVCIFVGDFLPGCKNWGEENS